MTNIDADLLAMFVQDSREQLDRLENDLLSLESEQHNTELINGIFRTVHNIKGVSGFFGLKNIKEISHVMENVMSCVRDGFLTPNHDMVDSLLAGTDKLRIMINDLDHISEMSIDNELKALTNILENKAGLQTPPPVSGSIPSAGRSSRIPDERKQESRPDSERLKKDEALEVHPVVLQPVEHNPPAKEDIMPASQTKDIPHEAVVSASSSRLKADETIRVSVSLLDDLMNLAGEMVLGRNQLMRMSENAKQTAGMHTILQNINLVTSDLQEKVMRTRLQPIDTIFDKFTRILRDMSHQLGKEMDLKITGGDVELDKTIIENLSDPLTHLIRNCADHGIESPAEREKAGKPRAGAISLAARHVGGHVHVEIIDDGRGLDAAKIKARGIEKGLLKRENADRLTDRQVFELIFSPGFSTADTVTEFSGRGVGMDVVKTNVEKMGGSIDLDSEKGKGTRICLRLPLTLAIIPAMIVQARDRRFAVPQVNLEEIILLDNKYKLESVRGSMVMRLRNKLLPLVDLKDLLGLNKAVQPETPSRAGYVLVLKADNNRYGLIVDGLLDSEEIVVKPLSIYVKTCKCYSGSTIMGDGKVAMILDTSGMATMADLMFTEIEKENLALAVMQKQAALAEAAQLLLLFRNAEKELFAVNMALVSRIEKIKAADIQKVGDKEFLKYADHSLRLLRLHDFMPVAKPAVDPEYLYVIVPKLVRHPIGLLATKVEDAVQSSALIDKDTIKGTGIFGSAVINGMLTLFLDVYSLFETAEPELYAYAKSANLLAGKRVLLVEDTAFFRTLESKFLSELGYQLETVNNGLEAWERLNKERYDVLVTDIEMPGISGLELTRRVRSSPKLRNLPVIALTVFGGAKHVQRGQEVGVDAYETKLDKEHLRQTMEKIANREQQNLLNAKQ